MLKQVCHSCLIRSIGIKLQRNKQTKTTKNRISWLGREAEIYSLWPLHLALNSMFFNSQTYIRQFWVDESVQKVMKGWQSFIGPDSTWKIFGVYMACVRDAAELTSPYLPSPQRQYLHSYWAGGSGIFSFTNSVLQLRLFSFSNICPRKIKTDSFFKSSKKIKIVMNPRRKQSCLSPASAGLHACCTELATE